MNDSKKISLLCSVLVVVGLGLFLGEARACSLDDAIKVAYGKLPSFQLKNIQCNITKTSDQIWQGKREFIFAYDAGAPSPMPGSDDVVYSKMAQFVLVDENCKAVISTASYGLNPVTVDGQAQ